MSSNNLNSIAKSNSALNILSIANPGDTVILSLTVSDTADVKSWSWRGMEFEVIVNNVGKSINNEWVGSHIVTETDQNPWITFTGKRPGWRGITMSAQVFRGQAYLDHFAIVSDQNSGMPEITGKKISDLWITTHHSTSNSTVSSPVNYTTVSSQVFTHNAWSSQTNSGFLNQVNSKFSITGVGGYQANQRDVSLVLGFSKEKKS